MFSLDVSGQFPEIMPFTVRKDIILVNCVAYISTVNGQSY